MGHRDRRKQVIASFQQNLQGANPIELLLVAEAAGSATDQSGAFNAAAAAVAEYISYPLNNYDNSLQRLFISLVGTYMVTLRYLTQGPSLAVPNGNYYNWNF
jgi:hypothetical protein